jgi:hypothetical protein
MAANQVVNMLLRYCDARIQQQPHAELRAKMSYGLLPKPSRKGQE